MELQLLVSAVGKEPRQLADKMHIASDAIIVNQGEAFAYEEFTHNGRNIKAYSFRERGVGLSRNTALLRADREICLFADEDIVYVDGYAQLVLEEFRKNPKADMILFNIDVAPERRTYHISSYQRVRKYNSGRYPTYSFAARLKRLRENNLTFSLLFGGGAKYSCGEDSLFLWEALKKGLKVYAAPVAIGREVPRESTWFCGYNEKFFYDRGVLYYYLYGKMASCLALRFLLRHKTLMCGEIPWRKAYALMKKGIREAKR